MKEEEAEIVGKTWRKVKAIAGDSLLLLLLGGHMLRSGIIGN